MKLSLKILFSLLSAALFLSCTKKDKNINKVNSSVIFKENNNIEKARSELKNVIIKDRIFSERIIPDSKTAVDMAENILFRAYGKENIINQRPYDVNFVEDYYIINGTMPTELAIGGTFLIIISSKDGKVIKLTHGE